jgi:hypothetical protein
MQEAVEELEAANEVFCGTAGALSMLTGLHKFQWKGAHVLPENVVEELSIHGACERIPDAVKAYVDADRKLALNAELIRKLDDQIRRVERELQKFGATISTSARRLPAPRVWPTMPPVGTGTDMYRTAARVRSPLAALKSGRDQTQAAIRTLSEAIGKGDLVRAKGLARSAASSLAALPAVCRQVRSYLKKSGLGRRVSRSRILGALRRLRASAPPRSALVFAKTFHLSRAKLKRLIRKAKAVPKSRIKAMSASDSVCSPRLDAIDQSLAAGLRKLAETL